jgi:hypothetical protein
MPRIGASPEIIRHHLSHHPCKDAHPIEVLCPCGNAVAILCSECGDPMFLAVNPEVWCDHAQTFYREHCVVSR